MLLKKTNKIGIYKILEYFIIYSFFGFVLETLFALVVYGKFESRQGLLYGSFCPIYGLGAVILIYFLKEYKENGFALFFGGLIIGSIVEYLVSLIGELAINVKWWDYSDRFLNINGRICLLYSIYWGIISIFLIRVLNPLADKFIELLKNKTNIKVLKIIVILITVFLSIDFVLSGIVLEIFSSRTIVENNIQAIEMDKHEWIYKNVYNNERVNYLMKNIWNEEMVIKAYPNLKIILEDKSYVLAQNYYKDVKPYYYNFNEE